MGIFDDVPIANGGLFADIPDDKPKESWGDYAEGIARSAAQGVTFGFGDEIAAGLGSAGNYLARKAGMDIPERSYDTILQEVRGADKQFGQEHPYVATTAEIGGSVATPIGALNALRAPTLAGRVARTAGAGAIFGGAAGFGYGEDGAENRLIGAGKGALTGAIAAPIIANVVAPAAGALARKAVSGAGTIGNVARDAIGDIVPGMRRNTDARLYRTLQRQNQTPEEALAYLEAGQEAAKFGRGKPNALPETIGDTGPAARRQVRAVEAIPGEASTQATEFLTKRSRESYERVTDNMRSALQVKKQDYGKTRGKVLAEQADLSKPAYEKAFSNKAEVDYGQTLFDAQFDEQAAAGPLRRALNKARNLFIEPSRGPGKQATLDTQRFDSGKRALDDMIEGARNAGRNNEARILTDLKNKLIAQADAANPDYGKARDIYRSRAELLDALEQGRTFMKGDADITASEYKALSTGEKRMFRIGMAKQAATDLGGKRRGNDMVAYFDRPNAEAVLSEIMSKKNYEKFLELNRREAGMLSSLRATQGSKTAPLGEDIADFNVAMKLGRNLREKGFFGATLDVVGGFIEKATRMREADANHLGRALFETDPAKQREILLGLSKKYGQKRIERGLERVTKELQRRSLGPSALVSGEQQSRPREAVTIQPQSR